MSVQAWPTLLPAPSADLSVRNQTGNVETSMESGRIRRRRRYYQQYRLIPVMWEMTDAQYAFFQSFHLYKINDGADEFTISLPIGGAGLRTFTVSFANKGEYSADYQPVLNWRVKAVLEVQLADVLTESEFDALVSAGSLATIGSYL